MDYGPAFVRLCRIYNSRFLNHELVEFVIFYFCRSLSYYVWMVDMDLDLDSQFTKYSLFAILRRALTWFIQFPLCQVIDSAKCRHSLNYLNVVEFWFIHLVTFIWPRLNFRFCIFSFDVFRLHKV
jgi:hypothetical protein